MNVLYRELKISYAVILMLFPILSCTVNDKTDDRITNSSFEITKADNPVGWQANVWGGNGETGYADTGRTGFGSVTLSSEEGGDLSWRTVVNVRPFSKTRALTSAT